MSWAEIKKVVNSDLSEPLNEKLADTETELKEQFGFQLVRTGEADSMSYSGTTGILIVGARTLSNSTSTPISIMVDGIKVGGINSNSSLGAGEHFGVFPFANSVSTSSDNPNYRSYTNYVLLALGGGIS